jgi:uncharacterized protein (DUF1778 family)
MGPKKTRTILFRCTELEYAAIHEAALAERRTLSGFLLKAALERIEDSRDNKNHQPESTK